MRQLIIHIAKRFALFFLIALIFTSASQADTFVGSTSLVQQAYRWQSQAHIFLGKENVTLSYENLCVYDNGAVTAGACSDPTTFTTYLPFGGSQQTPYVKRYEFYYEMGHEYDWTMLTDNERQYLAMKWHTHAPWLDSQAGLQMGQEDGLEGIFPKVFTDCAFGWSTKHQTVQAFPMGPTIHTGNFNTCTYLQYVTRHTHTWR